MKLLIFFSTFIYSFSSLASALVCVKGDELEIYSNLIFYGNEASLDVAKSCTAEINRLFNEPKVKINIGGKDLTVKIKASYQVESEEDAISSTNINKRIENNYIRIEKLAKYDPNNRSTYIAEDNCGYFSTKDGLGKSTTCAHEFGHGLGLYHNPETILLGKGVPGIMSPRATIVDPQFQFDPKAAPSKKGGYLNPIHRKVLKQDILNLKLEKLSFDENGCAKLGRASNIAFKENGEVILTYPWEYLVDGLDFIYHKAIGDLSQPLYCD